MRSGGNPGAHVVRMNICIELGADFGNVYADVELDPSPHINGIWLVADGKPDLEITDYLTDAEKVQASQTMIAELESLVPDDGRGDWLYDCKKDDKQTGDI